MNQKKVIIVGGGFSGMNCAEKLIRNPNIHVTLIDKNNYHEFTPFLYQVATSALASENVAVSLRHYFENQSNIDIKMTEVSSIDPGTNTVFTKEGETYTGDYIVLAAGSVVNFFNTEGAEKYTFPLYTLPDAERLRSRILSAFELADRNSKLIDQGVLNFVIIGAGPTGVEVSGAIADMINIALPKEFSDIALQSGKIYLVDHSETVLKAFSIESQNYATKVLKKKGIHLTLGNLVKEVGPDYILLSDGEKIFTKTMIWAGGLKASPLADFCHLNQGHGGRIDTKNDLTIEGFPHVYALGDFANIVDSKGNFLPQLASVAKQSGEWAAKNILADIEGKARTAFEYDDRGIMAMIGKSSAVVEAGKSRRELKGILAYLTWLMVHASLLSTFRQKFGALLDWSWNFFGNTKALQILDRTDVACHENEECKK